MNDLARSSAVDIHDLRHHLSLLALDLRLSREGLDAVDPMPAYAALMDRLDTGLGAVIALLAGKSDTGDGVLRPDRAELVSSIWNRFCRAGLLHPESSEFHCESPLHWPGEESHWVSLLVNLLENATKAAPDGPVSLHADGHGLRIANGGSMPSAAVVEALRHGEAPAPDARSGHGRGLGLILEASRALKLSLELDLGEARCRFSLLRTRADAARILLVEDDPDLRAMLAEYIRAEGFRVDAIDHADGELPAVDRYVAVVADMGLPGRGGEALLADLKQHDPGPLTLLLTGAGAAVGHSFPGVDAVIIKPGLDRLRELLAPLLAGKSRT